MTYTLHAERSVCVGAGQCLTARENVDHDEDGKVVVLNDGAVTEEQLGDVQDAVLTCPVEALTLKGPTTQAPAAGSIRGSARPIG